MWKTLLCDYFLFQMLVNSSLQIPDTFFKRFVEILPKVLFFILFKAVFSLSIYLTTVLQK